MTIPKWNLTVAGLKKKLVSMSRQMVEMVNNFLNCFFLRISNCHYFFWLDVNTSESFKNAL